jgi:hypothetical protein
MAIQAIHIGILPCDLLTTFSSSSRWHQRGNASSFWVWLVNETMCVRGNIAEKRESTMICHIDAPGEPIFPSHTQAHHQLLRSSPSQAKLMQAPAGLTWLGFASQAFFLSVLSSGAYHTGTCTLGGVDGVVVLIRFLTLRKANFLRGGGVYYRWALPSQQIAGRPSSDDECAEQPA